ncbi:MAG: DNRLRE domain-containing protein [Candidatus Bathyarchaeota archaeon]|nr:MAG: DNRLRE domain-containing protein [Candidatus Bathyarchaeota archaeon]
MLENVVLGLLCTSILTLLFAANVQGASLTLSMSSQDAPINSTFPDWNYGANTYLDIGATFGIFHRALVQFNLPPELSGATITSATLSLYYGSPWTAGGFPAGTIIRACRVTHDWTEGTGKTGAHTLDGVTWNEYNYFDGLTTATNDWSTTGGDYTLTDSSTVTGPFTAPVWMSWTVTNIVQGWASGAYPNHGFLIKLDPEAGSPPIGGGFGSKESTIFLPPKLEITYIAPTGVPELAVTVPVVASIATAAYLIIKKRISR